MNSSLFVTNIFSFLSSTFSLFCDFIECCGYCDCLGYMMIFFFLISF